MSTYDNDNILEELIDSIFGSDSLLHQLRWEKAVLDNCEWIFDTDQIRNKLFGIEYTITRKSSRIANK